MRLVLCSPCRPHGCVFPAEDVNERRQAIPEGTTTTLYQLRVAHEVKQTRPLAFLLEIVRRRESAPTRSKHVPGVLASSHETDRRAKKPCVSVRVPIPFYKSRAGRRASGGETRTTRTA